MSWRSDRFNARMRSLDAMAEGRDAAKWPLLSDRGEGERRMVEAIDGPDPAERAAEEARLSARGRKLDAACRRLQRAKLGHLVPTLRLIVKNGNNRKESIWTIATSRPPRPGKPPKGHISDIAKNL